MTATINNQLVFELAQSKGYIPTDYTLNENGFHGFLSEDQFYLEMCFIQKWLMHEHGWICEVHFLPQNFKFYCKNYNTNRPLVSIMDMGTYTEGFVNGFTTYESALLHGINEALQLI